MHHEQRCHLYREDCEGCDFSGNRSDVARNGKHHRLHCPQCRGECDYCGVEGAHSYIFAEGFHHHHKCPLRTLTCDGCGIHHAETTLVEPVLWNHLAYSCGDQIRSDPRNLLFPQDSISCYFHDGSSVFSPRRGTPKILACFHAERDRRRLYALNNRTLFNAIHNGVGQVIVNIVEKPDDWPRRFTGSRPWMCVKVRGGFRACAQALRIPAQAFPSQNRQSSCFVVLEVRGLINQKNNTFYNLLKEMSSDLDVRFEAGQREFARVRVNENDVPLVRSMAKALAERMGKKARDVDCVEVEGQRRYETPRDD